MEKILILYTLRINIVQQAGYLIDRDIYQIEALKICAAVDM